MHPIAIVMNEKQLEISFNGEICAAAVQCLLTEIRLGFEYYQFSEITLRLDSPGGEYKAMQQLIEACHSHRAMHRRVRVHAGQQCASAAALILAQSSWGDRTIEPDTKLLFHWVRTGIQPGQALTSSAAASLAKGLYTVDQHILDQTLEALCLGTGGVPALVQLIYARMQILEAHWGAIAHALTPATGGLAQAGEWFKNLKRHHKRWLAHSNPARQKAAVHAYLSSRFALDSMMDPREAYALCLIDVVTGVLPVKPDPVQPAPAPGPRITPPSSSPRRRAGAGERAQSCRP